MRLPWDKYLPKFIVIHTKRSTKNTQNNDSGVSDHEDDTSVPPVIDSTSRETGRNAIRIQSMLRAASDIAQLALPGVGAVAGVIPVAGVPLQAAISGLLFILQSIDRNLQNRQDIAGLESRLKILRACLDNAPNTTDEYERDRREMLTGVLEGTSSKLTSLKKRGFGYTSKATQAINGCSSEINNYLLLYSFSYQMQAGGMLATLLHNQSPGTFPLQCVTLVDATGCKHHIQLEHCASFRQLTKMLGVIFERDTAPGRVQRRYLEAGQYVLGIDHGTEVTQLTSDSWSSIEVGGTIVMSIVVTQLRSRTEAYQCYVCKTWNDISFDNRTQICVIDCRGCRRRLQVSIIDGRIKEKQGTVDRKVKHENVSPTEAAAAETQLIRNWRVEQEELEERLWNLLRWEENERRLREENERLWLERLRLRLVRNLVF